ncbi:MAG: V-type ATP synthase subunit D [Candidatus Competibacterales bacterium]
MALTLNKATLAREQRRLATFQRFLPALDLKRRQLLAARAEVKRAIATTQARRRAVTQRVAEDLPMVADKRLDLEHLVTLETVTLGTENVVGVSLPTLEDVELTAAPYAYLARPHWVDALVARLREAITLGVQEDLERQRLERLEAAVRIVTQRVNLFDKVLIPRTRGHIRRLQIHLGDAQRAAVVRAKFAKTRSRAHR